MGEIREEVTDETLQETEEAVRTEDDAEEAAAEKTAAETADAEAAEDFTADESGQPREADEEPARKGFFGKKKRINGISR